MVGGQESIVKTRAAANELINIDLEAHLQSSGMREEEPKKRGPGWVTGAATRID